MSATDRQPFAKRDRPGNLSRDPFAQEGPGLPFTAGRYVGQRVARKEHRRLVAGHGRYIDDVVVPGMVHAAFVRSQHARGVIRELDVSEARAVPGVVAVLTAEDLNPISGPMYATLLGPAAPMPPMRALAEGDVRYVGEPIAVVVAESRYVAEDAADLVVVDVEALPPVLDVRAALESDEQLVHPEKGTNLAQSFPATDTPELDDAFATAHTVVTRTFTQSRQTNVPMEPRGVVAHWEPGSETFAAWVASQNPHEHHAHFARVLQVPHHQVRIRMGDVGGGFGQKIMVTRDEDCVVLASKALGMPVKWIEDRRENLIAANQARHEIVEISMAVDADARITGCRARHWEEVGAYAVGGHNSASGNLARFITGPYRIPHVGFAGSSVYTNRVGRAAYRGPWVMETTTREQMIDHVARELGIDPLELRRRNVILPGELPYTTASGMLYEHVSLSECLEQATSMVDVEAFRAEQAAARGEGRLLGLGISLYVEPSGMAMGALATEQANVRIDAAGKVWVLMGTGDHGQNIPTTMSQLVAEHLGCSIDDIEFVQGDTLATPFGGGTGGSRTAVIAGGAATIAAQRLKAKVFEIAAHLLEADPADLQSVDGMVSVRGVASRPISFTEIAAAAYLQTERLPAGMEPGLEASCRYKPPAMYTFSNACHVCTCEVDTETGLVRLLRYVVSEDCGRMINPTVVEGQIDGGVVQGIGGVLYEHMVYDDDGNPLASTFLDYLLPGAAEMPVIEHAHLETPSASEGGYKGVGEGGAIGAPAAVANAVADALAPLGVRIESLPLGPSQIVELIRGAPSPP